MNIFCNSDGVIFHVIPDRIFQGSAGVNKIYFIGQFPSSAQVLMAYHLPNGISTTPKMLTPVPQAQELQSADGGKFSVWEGRIGASPKVEDGQVVKDKNGNVVYDLDYTITENYGTARMQFSVFGACQGTSVGEMAMNLEDGVLATSAVEFKIEKGVPAVLPNTFAEAGDFSAVLGQILSALSSAQTSYNNISAENKSINAAFDGINATLDAHTAGISTNNASIEELRGKDAQLAHDLEVHTIHANATFGTDITAEMSQTDYKLTLRLKNANGEYIGNGVVIDLPLEELVVSGTLDDYTNEIVLTLKSGQEIRIKVGELVRGLVTNASKGQPYGVASLDADGKVPEYQLPEDIKKGKGKGAIQQVADGVANGFDFAGKNPNAEKLDNTLIGIQPYGGVGDYANAFGGKSSAQGKRSHAEGTTTVAKGKYSHAEGDNTVTLADDSHAEGYKTLAAGYSSHAEGANTQALASYSHAEGLDGIAGGEVSHVEGQANNAYGYSAHAEGTHTVAEGYASHTEGAKTMASGQYSHAEGYETNSSGDNAHAEGAKTEASGEHSHAEGAETIASEESSHAEGYHTHAEGQISHAEGAYTNAKGMASHAEGYYAKAIGFASHASGGLLDLMKGTDAEYLDPEYSTEAHGKYSFAANASTRAYGYGSSTFGENTEAYQVSSMAVNGASIAGLTEKEFNLKWKDLDVNAGIEVDEEGNVLTEGAVIVDGEGWDYPRSRSFAFSANELTKAKGRSSASFGNRTVANGDESFVGGYQSKANNTRSFAFGDNVEANGVNATAFGQYSSANGNNAFVGGVDSHASGSCSFAMGWGNYVWDFSGAFGSQNAIHRKNCFTAGYGNVIEGTYSTALGRGNAVAPNTEHNHVIGRYLYAPFSNQVIVGEMNQRPKNNPDSPTDQRLFKACFVVGIGNEIDGLEVLKDGTIVIRRNDKQDNYYSLQKILERIGEKIGIDPFGGDAIIDE